MFMSQYHQQMIRKVHIEQENFTGGGGDFANQPKQNSQNFFVDLIFMIQVILQRYARKLHGFYSCKLC